MTAKKLVLGNEPTPKESDVKLGNRIEAINAKGFIDAARNALKRVQSTCSNIDEALYHLGFAFDEIAAYLDWEKNHPSKNIGLCRECNRQIELTNLEGIVRHQYLDGRPTEYTCQECQDKKGELF